MTRSVWFVCPTNTSPCVWFVCPTNTSRCVWFVCPTNTSRCCVVCVLDMGHGRARALPKCHPCLLQGCPWYSHTPPLIHPPTPCDFINPSMLVAQCLLCVLMVKLTLNALNYPMSFSVSIGIFQFAVTSVYCCMQMILLLNVLNLPWEYFQSL